MFKKKRKGGRDTGLAGGPQLLRQLAADLGELDAGSRVAIEAYTSQMLASAAAAAGGAKSALTGALAGYLAQRGDAAAAAVLAAVADLSDDWRLRLDAQDKVDAMAQIAPEWSRDPVVLGTCWVGGDVYGDRSDVVLTVGAGAQGYALTAQIGDHGDDTALCEIKVEPDLEVAVEALRRTHDGELCVVKQEAPGRAVERVTDALAATPAVERENPDSTVFQLRPLLEARMRLAPGASRGADGQDRGRATVSPQLVEQTAREFLSAPEAMFLPGGDATVTAAKSVAAHHLRGGLRVSPARTESFLSRSTPTARPAETPEVLEAFNQWAAIQAGVPQYAITALLERTRELVDRETRTEGSQDAADLD